MSHAALPDCLQAEECGGGGDCLFHVLAKGLNVLFAGRSFAMQGVRDEIGAAVQTHNVSGLGASVEQVRAKLLRQGCDEFGTIDLLAWAVVHWSLLVKNNVGFLVYSSAYGLDFPTVIGRKTTTRFMLLLNVGNRHWQILRYRGYYFISERMLRDFFLTKRAFGAA